MGSRLITAQRKVCARNFSSITPRPFHSPIIPDKMNIELSAYIGITGNPAGIISLEMNQDTSKKIMESVSNKAKVKKDKSPREIIREIANQVCGNALTELWQHGYDSEMTSPSLIYGDEIIYHHNRDCKESFFIFDTNCGKFLLKTFLHLK